MLGDAQRRASVRVVLLVFSVAVFGSCATPPEDLPSALAAAPAPRKVAYSLRVGPERATVTVSVRRPSTDPFVFLVPPTWPGGDDILPRATRSDGTELEVQFSPETWTVAGSGESSFELTYPLSGRPDATLSVGANPLAPTLGPNLFMGAGSSMFPLPRNADQVEEVQAEVVTEGGQWPVWTTWGRSDTSFRSASELADSLILAGEWKVSARESDDTLLQVAATPNYDGSAGDLRALLAKVLAFHSQVLGRYHENALLLVVVPAADEGGPDTVAVGDALLVFPRAGATEADITETLVRVLYRRWAGRKLASGAADADVAWFARGTEEYYGLRAAVTLGGLDDAALVGRLNTTIEDYYAHPARISNPAREGLLALLIDITLRADSQGLKSLDLFVRKVLFDLDGTDGKLTGVGLRERLEKFSGRPWADFFDAYVFGPQRLPLAQLDRGGLIMTTKPWVAYSLGFAVDGPELQDAALTEVSAKGTAHRAGLRKGDVIKSVKMSRSPDEPVHIEVVREGVDERIAADYMPKEEIEVPHVTEVTDLFKDWFMP